MLETAMQSLRQVFPDFQCRATQGALETLLGGRPMAFHHYPLQSEETGAVIACRSDIAAQPAQQRQRQRTDQLRRQSIAEALFDPRRHHGSQAFAGLQQDVADETVADHHVGLAAIQAIALYVSAEIQPLRLLQQTRRQLDLLVALDLLGPHVEQGDPGRDAAKASAATAPITAN